MHYVYILKSRKNGSFYVGTTNNVVRRLEQHNAGENISTRRYLPWICVYLEGYSSKEDAMIRESNLKIFGKAFGQLKRRIKNSLQMPER